MQYVKQLIQRKYHLFLGGAILFEMQRSQLLPKTPLYAKIKEDALKELKYTDPQTDYSELCLETMTQKQLNFLKSITKKKIVQIQNLSTQSGSTLPYTCSTLGLGLITFFIHPTISSMFLGSYLTILAADFLKSLDVIKYGRDPLWTWKMKDLGHVMTSAFGLITLGLVLRSGFRRLKQRVSKELVLIREGKNKE